MIGSFGWYTHDYSLSPERLGKKVRVKCNEDDTIGDLKKLAAAQLGTKPEKLKIQKWYTIYKDHITLEDYEIHDGMGLELYVTNANTKPYDCLFSSWEAANVVFLFLSTP